MNRILEFFLESFESLENYEILYEKNRNDLNKIL